MVRELELHVNRRQLPVRYRSDDERRLVETGSGILAEVRFKKLANGVFRKEILRRMREVRASIPRAMSLVVVKGEGSRIDI